MTTRNPIGKAQREVKHDTREIHGKEDQQQRRCINKDHESFVYLASPETSMSSGLLTFLSTSPVTNFVVTVRCVSSTAKTALQELIRKTEMLLPLSLSLSNAVETGKFLCFSMLQCNLSSFCASRYCSGNSIKFLCVDHFHSDFKNSRLLL